VYLGLKSLDLCWTFYSSYELASQAINLIFFRISIHAMHMLMPPNHTHTQSNKKYESHFFEIRPFHIHTEQPTFPPAHVNRGPERGPDTGETKSSVIIILVPGPAPAN
jgi:hypothetical protein